MSHLLTLSDGVTVDLHTKEGCYWYIGAFLRKNGASSMTFSALSKLYPHMEVDNQLDQDNVQITRDD